MASSSSFAVILVFVALGGVLAAEAAGRPIQGWDGAGRNDRDEGSLERLSIPSSLMSSSLDADQTAKYVALINENALGAHATEFCQEAKLQCSPDVAIMDPTLRISRSNLVDQELFQQTRDLVEATRALQFNRNDIQNDNEIALPQNLHDSLPAVSFLPLSIAEKMPFTSAKMPELFEKLSIPKDSHLAIMMSRTVGQCEAQEQGNGIRKCVTSLEGMKSFVSSNLPQDKHIVALDRSSTIPGNVCPRPCAGASSKDMWKVVNAKLYDHAVVCRNSVFPYAVFECHDTSKTSMHIYQVEMQSRNDGARTHQVAACHENGAAATTMTESLSAGSAQACHWITDSLIWAPAN